MTLQLWVPNKSHNYHDGQKLVQLSHIMSSFGPLRNTGVGNKHVHVLLCIWINVFDNVLEHVLSTKQWKTVQGSLSLHRSSVSSLQHVLWDLLYCLTSTCLLTHSNSCLYLFFYSLPPLFLFCLLSYLYDYVLIPIKLSTLSTKITTFQSINYFSYSRVLYCHCSKERGRGSSLHATKL